MRLPLCYETFLGTSEWQSDLVDQSIVHSCVRTEARTLICSCSKEEVVLSAADLRVLEGTPWITTTRLCSCGESYASAVTLPSVTGLPQNGSDQPPST